ncbi:hypothetical protein AC249_AIPGENE7356 [Exaiptasia diaphana]|nr:hypothetical protein AC249_AIPGENE7356 [Exaiptasia diaphana]
MVLISGDGTDPWNTRLVLKDKCPDDVARHKRLPSQGLQHVKSGLCVHTFGGHPGDGKYLVYDRTCPDEKRFQLLFFKHYVEGLLKVYRKSLTGRTVKTSV